MNLGRFNHIPYNLEIVNIGSGPSFHDFDWSAVKEVSGFNMAVAPEDFRYDARIIKHYGKHVKSFGGVVVAVISPLSFAENKYLYKDDFSEKYVSVLPSEDVDLPFWKYLLYKRIPIALKLKNGIKRSICFAKNRGAKAFRMITDKTGKEKGISDETERALKALVDDWIDQNDDLHDLKDAGQAVCYQEIFKEKIHDLELVIKNCRRQNLYPVLVIPPLSARLNSCMSREFVRAFLYDNLKNVCQEGIPLLDYKEDERFQDERMYSNGIFLKEEMKGKFTEIVWEDIQKIRKDWGIPEELREEDVMEQEGKRTYKLRNGAELPFIGFGTGVIWRYSRNPALFLKVNLREALSTIRHLKWNRELYGNLHIRGILRSAGKVGFELFDSGRIYSWSEKYIGDFLEKSEKRLFVTTKCSTMDIERKCSPDSVAGNLDVSLRYLKRDVVDLLLLHWPEGEHWLDYYAQIIDEYKKGRCRAFGACNMELQHLKAIEEAGLELPMVIQTELHPLNTRRDIRDYCKEHEIQLMAHTPTAHICREIRENKGMQEIAEKYGKSMAQIIIRWHYQNGVIPIVSCFNKKHMEENLAVFDFCLSEEEMAMIEEMNRNHYFIDTKGIDDPRYIYNL